MNHTTTNPRAPSAAVRSFISLRALLEILPVFALLAVLPSGCTRAAPDLEKSFVTPPDSAKPWSYWFWMNQNITRAGITADLEAMQRIGVGGLLLMDVNFRIPDGPVVFLSPEWRALFQHTLAEAGRLGLQITMNDDAGWSGSGGPWVQPDQAMKRLVWTTTRVEGGAPLSLKLPSPPPVLDYYRDAAVLAFPAPEETIPAMAETHPVFSSHEAPLDGSPLMDHDPNTSISLPFPRQKGAPYLRIEFARPFRAKTLSLTHPPRANRDRAERGVLQVSGDGEKFRTLHTFRLDWASTTTTFPETTSRFYRIAFLGRQPRAKAITLAEVDLSDAPRVQNWESKAGFVFINEHGGGAQAFADDEAALKKRRAADKNPPENLIRRDTVQDLTSRMDPQGLLTWTPPPGHWTLLRLGYTLTGAHNKPSTAAGEGLEPDKFDPRGIEAAFAGLMGRLIQENRPLTGRTLAYSHIDSWEVGSQTWTAAFPEEFRKRRGYDPLPWLPVMAGGHVVENPELSERFLWDVRRTFADLIASHYFGRMAQLCHEHGIKFQAEASGRQQFLYDPVAYQSKSDLPMGEFWIGGGPRVDCKVAASTAHLYGKPLVGAEAYTSGRGAWQDDPFSLKALGDRAFCLGINRYFFCCGNLQPWLDHKPGMTTGPWGMNFDRTQTWWEPGAAWVRYITRCQSLLQQGRFVADVLYLPGEGAPGYLGTRGELSPPLPPGYDYDGCDAETVLNRLSVENGRLAIPGGMSYRMLLLPATDTMTAALARRIRALVQAGALVIGPRPAHSPSLADYPRGDDEVRAIAQEVWGDCDGRTVREHAFGKGRVMWGKTFAEVAEGSQLPPDFECATGNETTDLLYIHRRIGEAEVYFISNPSNQTVETPCHFRVAGKAPELWNPDTGEMRAAPVFAETGGRTRVPLHLEPSGSVFVVFRHPKATPPAVAEGRNWPEFRPVQEITGAWDVSFPPDWGAPPALRLDRLISWPEHPDAGVKYFSGTATYRKTFEISPDLLRQHPGLRLDLGRVKNLAEVRLNGRELGTAWKPPFRLATGSALKPGSNELEVRVTNLWPNRLIGDEQLPDDCEWIPNQISGSALKTWPDWFLEGRPRPGARKTFTTWKHYTKDSPLLESGLLGPVTLQADSGTIPPS